MLANIKVGGQKPYFVNIAKNLADSIPVDPHFSTYLNDPSDNTFKFDLVTERDVAYIIHNLKNKKSYGHDYLSNILLKRAQATLVKPLTFLKPLFYQYTLYGTSFS